MQVRYAKGMVQRRSPRRRTFQAFGAGSPVLPPLLNRYHRFVPWFHAARPTPAEAGVGVTGVDDGEVVAMHDEPTPLGR